MYEHVILIIHGAAIRTPDFAAPLVANLKTLLPTGAATIVPGFYGDLLEPLEAACETEMETNPLWKREHFINIAGFPVRSFVNRFVWDLFQWDNTPNVNEQILLRLLSYLPDGCKVHLVLHSWANVMVLEHQSTERSTLLPYIEEHGRELLSVTSLGNVLHLDDLGRTKFTPEFCAKWTNFFHTDDIFGTCLQSVYGCQDIEVTDAGPPDWIVGGEEIAGAFAAHNCYIHSLQVAEHIAAQVMKHV